MYGVSGTRPIKTVAGCFMFTGFSVRSAFSLSLTNDRVLIFTRFGVSPHGAVVMSALGERNLWVQMDRLGGGQCGDDGRVIEPQASSRAGPYCYRMSISKTSKIANTKIE